MGGAASHACLHNIPTNYSDLIEQSTGKNLTGKYPSVFCQQRSSDLEVAVGSMGILLGGLAFGDQ